MFTASFERSIATIYAKMHVAGRKSSGKALNMTNIFLLCLSCTTAGLLQAHKATSGNLDVIYSYGSKQLVTSNTFGVKHGRVFDVLGHRCCVLSTRTMSRANFLWTLREDVKL